MRSQGDVEKHKGAVTRGDWVVYRYQMGVRDKTERDKNKEECEGVGMGKGDYKLIIEQLCSFSFSSDQKGNREKPQTCFIPYKEVREMDSAPPVPAGGGTPEAGSNGGGTE